MFTLDMIEPLVYWINEREAIRIRKSILEHPRGVNNDLPNLTPVMQKAWGSIGGWSRDRLTDDPILREYRFCNVQREDDRVTRWVRENIREPFADHPNLWLMLCIARQINWPPTLQMLMRTSRAWPHDNDFSPEVMSLALEEWQAAGNKLHTGAYLIRAASSPREHGWGWSKCRYLSEIVTAPLWEVRDEYVSLTTLRGFWERLSQFQGWGPFLSYQVVVDLRWTRYLRSAPDIQTWAAAGPGSKRGINRLLSRTVEAPLTQEQGLEAMLELRSLLAQPGVLAPWVELPDLSDVQNCLCETDKYLRVKNGEGRPRAKYVPGRGY